MYQGRAYVVVVGQATKGVAKGYEKSEAGLRGSTA
jgi:hypothetical protein